MPLGHIHVQLHACQDSNVVPFSATRGLAGYKLASTRRAFDKTFLNFLHQDQGIHGASALGHRKRICRTPLDPSPIGTTGTTLTAQDFSMPYTAWVWTGYQLGMLTGQLAKAAEENLFEECAPQRWLPHLSWPLGPFSERCSPQTFCASRGNSKVHLLLQLSRLCRQAWHLTEDQRS
eukprot:1142650-Pelagomonas_calceolata.AAC.1